MQVIRRKSFSGTIPAHGGDAGFGWGANTSVSVDRDGSCPLAGATERDFHADRSWRKWKAATRVWLPHASCKPPTMTGFMVTGVASITGNGGYPPFAPEGGCRRSRSA